MPPAMIEARKRYKMVRIDAMPDLAGVMQLASLRHRAMLTLEEDPVCFGGLPIANPHHWVAIAT